MKKHIILTLYFTISIFTCFSQSKELTDGLIAYYPFSGNASDVTENGYDGIIFGSPLLTSDRFNTEDSAYEFDGIYDYINTFSTFDFENRSLSVWIMPYSVIGSGGTSNNTLTHVAITQDAYYLEYGALRVDIDDGNLKLWAGGANGTYIFSPIMVEEWYHLVLVRKEGTTRYYINGENLCESTSDDIGSTFNPNGDFIIGCGRSTNNQFYKGKIDDVMIYNRPLNDYEIVEIFEGETLSNEYLILENNDFLVYPNPTSGMINITNKNSLELNIEIYDIAGNNIATYSKNDNPISINLEKFSHKMYIVKITSLNRSIVKKVLMYL